MEKKNKKKTKQKNDDLFQCISCFALLLAIYSNLSEKEKNEVPYQILLQYSAAIANGNVVAILVIL